MITELRVLIEMIVLTRLMALTRLRALLVLMLLLAFIVLIELLVIGNVNAQSLNVQNANYQNLNTKNFNTGNANTQNANYQHLNYHNGNAQNTHNLNTNVRLLNISGEPIKLALVVGQEVQLNFDNHLGSLGTPISLKDKIKTQMIDTRLWLKAVTAFSPTRLLVRNQIGEISVFLLSANTNTSTNVSQQSLQPQPIKYSVVSYRKPASQNNAISNSLGNTQDNNPNNPNNQQSLSIKPRLSYIDLTRFAAQTLYAPKRLITNINLIRLPINTKKAVRLFDCSTTLACNDNVLAIPIATWQSSNLYISAILLKNTTTQTVVLDPRDLLGAWSAATFHFNRLGRTNSPEDTSVVYLISLLAFEQSL